MKMEKPSLKNLTQRTNQLNSHQFLNQFDTFSEKYLNEYFESLPQAKILSESMRYSFISGGKRFRPYLTYLVSELFKKDFNYVLPFSLAVEMIHTYSLIHDDLPCMDNDDLRRGQPTNHKVFGEDIALLAGDSFLTLAFQIIADKYTDDPKMGLRLIHLLSHKIGFAGMIGGQVIDIKSSSQTTTDDIWLMHKRKTADLIEISVIGAALICKADSKQLQILQEFGKTIGLAFQVKDDLLDAHEKEQDHKNLVQKMGPVKAKEELTKLSQLAEKCLSELSLNTHSLQELIQFNLTRVH